jgi:VanZ family protein
MAKGWKQAFDDPIDLPNRRYSTKSSNRIRGLMFRTLTAVAAWLSLAFIAYATLSPLNERPEISGLFSHFDHYLAYAVAGGLFAFAYPRHAPFVCIIVFGSAVLLELAQLLTPDRHARVLDALRKLIGGALGIAFALVLHWFWNRFDGSGREP